jgi:hypothetical protein
MFFTNKLYNILLIAIIGLVVFYVLTKVTGFALRERYEDTASSSEDTDNPMPLPHDSPREYNAQPGAAAGGGNAAAVHAPTLLHPQEQHQQAQHQQPPAHQQELMPEELLPKDINSKWAQANPSGQGMLADRNFLDAGHHVGVNTVGQTLRNANYNVRSEFPNPQLKVSPWLQSTIDPDVGRKPLEIGAGW